MLIINGNLITWEQPNRILEGQALYIKDEIIVELGPQTELIARYPQEERLDANGQYVMPGNICAQTHFYGAFARGMAIPGLAPEDFPEILSRLWWPLDKSLTPEDVYYSSLVCLIDAIRHGTTSLVDHHASPNAIEGSLDEVARAVEQSGLRAALCYEVTDRDGEQKARQGIAENVRFLERVKSGQPAGGRLAALFGLHASLTLSDETLDCCREAIPSESGFHIHVAEGEADEYDSLAKSGQRVVDRLAKHGILGPHTIAAHAVHVDAREIALLGETGTWVSHQPRSNMNNGVGIAPVESMLRSGVKVGLGNDGLSNAMWEEWKAAYLVQKVWHRDPRRMSALDVIQMAIYNNAGLLSQLFSDTPIGVIASGASADLIFVDDQPYTPLTAGNLPWHMLFGFHESLITTTIVAGQVLMRDRQILTLDEAAISAHARELSQSAWKRYEEKVGR